MESEFINGASNDLVKYSYFLAYFDSNGTAFGNATGFILKRNNQSYLITNVHVLFGLNVSDLSVEKDLIGYGNYKIGLRYANKDGENNFFDIEIDKQRSTLSRNLFPKMLDLVSFQLPSLPNDGIYYYINEDFKLDNETKCNDIAAIGYPAIDYFKEQNCLKRVCRVKSGSTIGEVTENGRRIETNLIIEQGMSGSPIFALRDNFGKQIIKFYGIGDGFNPDINISHITRFAGSSIFSAYFG